ncbi:MAG: hypothetical protein ACI9DJ_003483 [Algoriphagus sp.]|jgi:hypothetical protein
MICYWKKIDPLTQDACVFPDYTDVVLETKEGKKIAKAYGENKAAISKKIMVYLLSVIL